MIKGKAVNTKGAGSRPLATSNKTEAEQKTARILTNGAFNAVLLEGYGNVEGMPDLSVLYEHLQDNARGLKTDEGCRLHRAEGMLLSQATALQTMFIDLALRAKRQQNREWLQTLTSLALRAQGNCTQTLRVLAELRSPRQPVFAKQANIAHGAQQVNNGTDNFPTSTRVRAREAATVQNELLEADHGQRLDIGAPAATGCADQRLDTVGQVHRAEDVGGKGARQS